MATFPTFKLWTFMGVLFLLSTCTATQTSTELSEKEQKDYLQKGQTLAQQSFAALSSRLTSAIEAGGIPYAIEYCHTTALPLVDSLSTEYNASIRRTSLKVRNPKDTPQDWEITILQSFQQELAAGKRPGPVVKVLDKKHIAFATPIYMAQPCLKCHGKLGETLNEQHYSTIKKRYPADQAIGYVDGDWRGMWSITFLRK